MSVVNYVDRISLWWRRDAVADLGASLVVFLVAVPLCVGVAVASGAPAELGIVTGIVGGLVVGVLPGSSLQVSGPAAGLTVLVAEAVARHGLPALGVIVAASGLMQVLMGLARLGGWFRAISPSVVQGMLAGIGLVLLLGQVYPVFGARQPGSTAEKLLGLPGLVGGLDQASVAASFGVGALTLAVVVGWQRMPARLRVVPGALVAVVLTAAAVAVFGLPVATVEVGGLGSVIDPPGPHRFGMLADPAVLGAAVTFALVASAESLFSAAAVDRMHSGPPTRYNTELIAQGVGNTAAGMLGALPMTAVIVRSAANVQAGARTKASRVLHGAWLLLFAVWLPGLLALVPLSTLAALLLHAGWKLLDLRQLAALARAHRAEAGIVVLTAGVIAAVDLLVGVLVGLAAAVAKAAWDVSHFHVTWQEDGDDLLVRLSGNATFLRLPRLLAALQEVPSARRVRLDLSGVRHLDRACRQAVENWAAQRRRGDSDVRVSPPVEVGV
ncbi:Sulfate permease, MFS superfamily [Streptoalloteichus tenebrarius]|uniref:Sulfate permease, MFS superfamily n=1 Tax=Streptoalloteichus tenebrarius (strain ATCC 17920 / DSM 40477 / JCM 4838 / CBS 697.72 / NBRC 16177 / NCIMB 11028 / NRRL B-12390 / A12253. 1 / ISP 5477) TaxID=1933 RepID=A0ABT1HSB0_STRSD|nr:SulP family inorganic anion transporter [Streptoalloteichus tenebrarius]MCP2258407.1 Sulfate permease, MFS superfamily [Streptoalloteichus tenebrarius]BFF03577.1 SulP family inorganic anion transporter [Streptoalloteichus tenebrarius]